MDVMNVIAPGRIKRTQIMQKANLSWNVLRVTLQALEEKGIVKSENSGAEFFVSLTDTGYGVLDRLHEVRKAFGDGQKIPSEPYSMIVT